MDSSGGGDDMRAAIAALWRDARPRTIARIETLEQAIAALADGALDGALAERACQDAHKLAGLLGTFGMPDGTGPARELERAFRDGVQPHAAAGLTVHVVALRRIVDDAPA
jgi:HPt (histidine-containing phosphotransfer) domain-containing protein